MNKNNMNDTTKIASAINDLKNVKIPVKIDGENKTITKITPVPGHDGMYYFEVAEKDSILTRIVMPFDDEYDVCVKAVNDYLNKKNCNQTFTENRVSKSQTNKYIKTIKKEQTTNLKENTNMTTKLNEEMIKQLNSEIRAFNKTITSSTTNKEIWDKKVELSKKYGLKTIGRCVSENEYEYLKISKFKENDECLYIRVGKKTEAKKTDVKKTVVKKPVAKKTVAKKTEVKKVVNTRKNKYFYDHVPSFKMNKDEIKSTLGLIAKGITKFPFKLNQDFMVNGFNYLTENQKNEVGTASRKYYNENKKKHIEMKKNEFFAINDAKLILKYL
ncbi:MAG: hypothetical protein ACOCM4_02155 [Acetivibrio ethanolgignens]